MGGAIISQPRQGHVLYNEVFSAAAWGELVVEQGTGAKIQVRALVVSADGATNVTFGSNEVAIAGPYYFAAKGGLVLPYNPFGYFETVANEPLDVLLSAAEDVSVNVIYVVTT